MERKINALLTKRQGEDWSARAGCMDMRPEHAPQPTYKETSHVAYLSPRLLSIDARVTNFGCGAYPNIAMVNPLTISLVDGNELDWHQFFEDSFLDPKNYQATSLMAIYRRHAGLNHNCSRALDDYEPNFDLWLDSRNGQLMVKPSIPHVTQYCAKLIGIPFSEIEKAVRNPMDREDLLDSGKSAYSKPTRPHLP